MHNILYFFLITSTITIQKIDPNWFIGCSNQITNNIRDKITHQIVYINFEKPCLNLITCAFDFKKDRSNCEEHFFTDMNLKCRYFDLLVSQNWRKKTCLEISKRNYELVKNLSHNLFRFDKSFKIKNNLEILNKILNFPPNKFLNFPLQKNKLDNLVKNKFLGLMALQDSIYGESDECLDRQDFIDAPCDVYSSTQVLTGLELRDGKMILKTTNGNCFSKNEEFDVKCDFEDLNQRWEFNKFKNQENIFSIGKTKGEHIFFIIKI